MSAHVYKNISQQDLHLHPVGTPRRDRIVVAPGETSPPVELSKQDIQYLVHTTGFLVPEVPAAEVPVAETVEPITGTVTAVVEESPATRARPIPRKE